MITRMMRYLAAMVVALWPGFHGARGGEAVKVGRDEARCWIRHVIPLPKHITIRKAVRIPATNVVVVVGADAPELVRVAAARLAACLGGVPQTDPAGPDQF